MRPVSPTALAAAAAAVLLAGCGGSSNVAARSPSGADGGARTGPATVTDTITTSAPTTTAATATGTTTSPAPAPDGSAACTAADLRPRFVDSNGAAGHVVLTFSLRNGSAQPCHTYGFPGIEFLAGKIGSAATPIATHATRTVHDFAGDTPLTSIALQPGQQASFRVITSDVASSAVLCQSATGLQIIAPDDTATMQVALQGAVSVCGGQATVSPLEPGTGAGTPA